MKKIDEKELHKLFSEFKENNPLAYNELYEEYYNLVYGIAFSIMKSKDDSEDITSEVFTKIYKLDKEKLPVSNEASWLFTVTRNECFSYLRKNKQNISIDEIYEIPSDSDDIQEIVDREYYNKLIDGLSEQEKTIISLKVLSNFTFDKISKMMNIPIGTVQWKYYKAINSLKISIGSLVGAIIAFVIVFLRREQIDNNVYKENESNKGNVYESSSNQENTLNDTVSSTDENLISNDSSIQISTIQDSKIIAKTNAFNVVTISIGIILFITFLLFFKKYQQKLKHKTSK